jgi:hypothetical protein
MPRHRFELWTSSFANNLLVRRSTNGAPRADLFKRPKFDEIPNQVRLVLRCMRWCSHSRCDDGSGTLDADGVVDTVLVSAEGCFQVRPQSSHHPESTVQSRFTRQVMVLKFVASVHAYSASFDMRLIASWRCCADGGANRLYDVLLKGSIDPNL